ncbi:MAG: hypothetical protein B7Z26_00420, partial [Asticcacaulis sp. 32-58-5]
YKVVDEKDAVDPRHNTIVEVFKYMRTTLTSLTARKVKEYDFPDIQQVVKNDGFMKALWSYAPTEEVVRFVTEKSAEKHYDVFVSLLRTLVLSRYFNTRMALTIVTTRSEDDAFDMFEALNTTGEPLTAFETFKPKVIEAEELLKYEGSESHLGVQRVEKYLETFKKADDRQKATSELLIPFALAETGEKLQKNLSDQRRYLREYFDKLPTIVEKRGVVTSLANLAAFMQSGWTSGDDSIQLEGFGKFDEETGFCFQALRALKHTVVIGALSRFYDEFRQSDDGRKAERKAELIEAIKAATAFSMLWRGGQGGTENIDSIYRNIMREGRETDSILPLAKRTKDKVGAVSLSGFKRILRENLHAVFADRDAWIKAASRMPIYKHSVQVAKFLIIVASDDAALDPNDPPLIIRGTKGLAPTLKEEAWGANIHFSVEHIAPQAANSPGWAAEIYEDVQTVDRLGNLTLLPTAENSYLGNKPWNQKHLIYRYLSAETPIDAQAIYAQFPTAGLTLSAIAKEILAGTSYMPMCKALSGPTLSWDVSLIDKRSVRIAELAYDRISPWLFG